MGIRPWWAAHELRLLRAIPEAVEEAVAVTVEGRAVRSNPALTTPILLPEILSLEECQQAANLARGLPHYNGAVDRANSDARRCRCTWLGPGSETGWLYDRVADCFLSANRALGFSLVGMLEPLMAVAYGQGDKFDWHVDAGTELAANRKLSMSIVLTPPSQYDGGDLEFLPDAGLVGRPEAGSAVVFPSYLAHRVAPVLSGKRIALVAFAHGASFR